MFCSNCGNPLDPTTGVCANCNTQQVVNPQPVRAEITEKDLPEKFKPLGAWSYFWLSVLFSIPVVGFIFLIIFSFNDSNRNRRSFARSQWCALLIVGILAVIIGVLLVILGVSYTDIISEATLY